MQTFSELFEKLYNSQGVNEIDGRTPKAKRKLNLTEKSNLSASFVVFYDIALKYNILFVDFFIYLHSTMLRIRSLGGLPGHLRVYRLDTIRLVSNKATLYLQQQHGHQSTSSSEKILFEDLRNNTRNFDETELKRRQVLTPENNSSAQKTWSAHSLPSKQSIQLQENKVNEELGKQKIAALENSAKREPTSSLRRSASAASQTSTRVSSRRRSRQQKAMKAVITLLPNALLHLKKLNNQPTPKFIKIGVTSKGCSGLSYDLQYVTEPNKYDEVVEQEGVKIIIDSKALLTIVGSEMDWVDDKLSNRFVFKNPNSKGTCGCGESFHV